MGVFDTLKKKMRDKRETDAVEKRAYQEAYNAARLREMKKKAAHDARRKVRQGAGSGFMGTLGAMGQGAKRVSDTLAGVPGVDVNIPGVTPPRSPRSTNKKRTSIRSNKDIYRNAYEREVLKELNVKKKKKTRRDDYGLFG